MDPRKQLSKVMCVAGFEPLTVSLLYEIIACPIVNSTCLLLLLLAWTLPCRVPNSQNIFVPTFNY